MGMLEITTRIVRTAPRLQRPGNDFALNLSRQFRLARTRSQILNTGIGALGTLGLKNIRCFLHDTTDRKLFEFKMDKFSAPEIMGRPINMFIEGMQNIAYIDGKYLIRTRIDETGEECIFLGETKKRSGGFLDALELVQAETERSLTDNAMMQANDARVKRRDALLELETQLGSRLRAAGDGVPKGQLDIFGLFMGLVPTLLPRVRSACVAIFDQGTNSLVPVTSLGIELSHLTGEGALSFALEVFQRSAGVAVYSPRLFPGTFSEAKREGDFGIFPISSGSEASTPALPFGVVTFSVEAGRHLVPDQVAMFSKAVGILGAHLHASRILDEIAHAASIDGLTGLFTRGAGERRYRADFGQARREDKKMSLVMIDGDKFKEVNDKYGHIAGDAVLKEMAKIASDVVGDRGYVVRYGGEEYLVVLNCGADEAAIIAEEIRSTIEARQIDIGFGRSLQKTASFGVAQLKPEDTTIETFINRVDKQALYQAKANGRNRVHLAK